MDLPASRENVGSMGLQETQANLVYRAYKACPVKRATEAILASQEPLARRVTKVKQGLGVRRDLPEALDLREKLGPRG